MKLTERQIILVNNEDKILGFKNKKFVHIKGLLHRAISIFIINSQNELMLQQRSYNKYHSSFLWSNTCCSHPFYNETILEAANRCLKEEMGFKCLLEKQFHFIYKARLDNGLIEHEFDHVFLGKYEYLPNINTEEVADWKWIRFNKLIEEIENNKEQYTIWFKIIIKQYIKKLRLLK